MSYHLLLWRPWIHKHRVVRSTYGLGSINIMLCPSCFISVSKAQRVHVYASELFRKMKLTSPRQPYVMSLQRMEKLLLLALKVCPAKVGNLWESNAKAWQKSLQIGQSSSILKTDKVQMKIKELFEGKKTLRKSKIASMNSLHVRRSTGPDPSIGSGPQEYECLKANNDGQDIWPMQKLNLKRCKIIQRIRGKN